MVQAQERDAVWAVAPGIQPNRIALFVESLEAGGTERAVLNLAGGLVDLGLQVDVVLSHAGGPLLSQVPPRARLIDLKARRAMESIPALVRYLQAERPAALIAAADHNNLVALWARNRSRVPTRVAVTEHTTISQMLRPGCRRKMRLMPFLIRWLYPQAQAVVTVSSGMADDLSHTTGLSRERIQVIFNPVVTPWLRERAQEPAQHPWFAPGEPPVVLGAGRLDAVKDFPTMIRALHRLRQDVAARLLILGEGRERPGLEQLVCELGLEDAVDLHGYVDNPYAYMARARLFVLSSHTEGLPTVLIEAMALGVPVVSTDCPSGGAREILKDGAFGRLVPVGQVDSLAGAMREALQSEPDPEPLRERAQEFTAARAASQYLSALRIVPQRVPSGADA